jgi:hypothetical protein
MHYTPERKRRANIESAWNACFGRERFHLTFVTAHDREQPSVRAAYVYDKALYRQMIQSIKDLLIGYAIARTDANASYKKCVEAWRAKNTTLDQDLQAFPWLWETPSPGDVSLILKHREAWARLTGGDAQHAVIAEDDIILNPASLSYLLQLMEHLPDGAEYVDIAGGLEFYPRADNRLFDRNFYEIDPPKTRTTCAAIVSRSFARRLIALDPPICFGIDWMLNWAFGQLGTKVYWAEPTVFGHGSQMRVYSSLREEERAAGFAGADH